MAIENQLDFLLNTKASFDIIGANAFSTNIQKFTIPSVYGYEAIHVTPMANAPLPGNKADFGYMEITFLVTENMESYLEIINWARGIYAFERTEEYKNKKLYLEEAVLTTYTSANNANMKIKLIDCFPLKIEEVSFDLQTTHAEPVKCKVSFSFLRFDIEVINPTLPFKLA